MAHAATLVGETPGTASTLTVLMSVQGGGSGRSQAAAAAIALNATAIEAAATSAFTHHRDFIGPDSPSGAAIFGS